MFQSLILGIIQGVAEWLPVSSEGMIILVQTRVFGSDLGLSELVSQALFLHLGTFLAALVYFRHDVWRLLRGAWHYKYALDDDKKMILFLALATLISGLLGLALLRIVETILPGAALAGVYITALVGVLLLATGFLQIKSPEHGKREVRDLRIRDGIILGVVQGFAALPGLSRSGLTVAALLFSKFEKKQALRLSFLLSLPIVLGGNIVLNIRGLAYDSGSLLALAAAFVFGLLTIDALLRLAEKINFGYFVLLFGVLTIVSAFI